MQKLTLLEMVQDILSGMDGDEVNSINDTVESMQVAQIIKTTYAHLIDGRDWAHLYSLFQLDSSTDVNLPTHMKLPEDVVHIDWLKYDKKKLGEVNRFRDVIYKHPMEFVDICNQRRSDAGNVVAVEDPTDILLLIVNDAAPTYWTSFDDEHIVFDSWDSSIDTTLQNHKTQCYGKRLPAFEMVDEFVPDMPAQAFSLLLAEAKAHASLSLRQLPDSKAQEYSVTQRRRMSQEAWRTAGGITIPNYGRKRK